MANRPIVTFMENRPIDAYRWLKHVVSPQLLGTINIMLKGWEGLHVILVFYHVNDGILPGAI